MLDSPLTISNWCLDIINPIHKEGAKCQPDNYRGKYIMNSLLQILCTVMKNSLYEYCEQKHLLKESYIPVLLIFKNFRFPMVGSSIS